MRFKALVQFEIEDGDTELALMVPKNIIDRFDGTGIHVESVDITEVRVDQETMSMMKERNRNRDEILKKFAPPPSSMLDEPAVACFLHQNAIGRVVYLVDGKCPLIEEHNTFKIIDPGPGTTL